MNKKKKLIFICTGNSCRSQMAEGLLRDMAGDKFEVFSAGSHPSRIHPMSIKVMDEVNIDITEHTSDPIGMYLGYGIDYVITLCDNAREFCPTFPGKNIKLHWSVDDPFKSWRDSGRAIKRYRKSRDEIKERIENFLKMI